jgi:uncharacterized membrane protein (DUF485 family)
LANIVVEYAYCRYRHAVKWKAKIPHLENSSKIHSENHRNRHKINSAYAYTWLHTRMSKIYTWLHTLMSYTYTWLHTLMSYIYTWLHTLMSYTYTWPHTIMSYIYTWLHTLMSWKNNSV